MDRANSNSTTLSPVDSSRRRFMTVAAAASAVSAGSLEMAAMPAHQCDAEIVAAGAQFEAALNEVDARVV
jgi:hypothetical protein